MLYLEGDAIVAYSRSIDKDQTMYHVVQNSREHRSAHDRPAPAARWWPMRTRVYNNTCPAHDPCARAMDTRARMYMHVCT